MNHIHRIRSHATVLPSAVGTGTVPQPAGILRWLNMALLVAALGLLMYYVTQVNGLAAQTWKTGQLNDRLAALRDQHDVLVAKATSLDDHQTLAALAAQQGMVPADSVVYLVQDRSVTAAR